MPDPTVYASLPGAFVIAVSTGGQIFLARPLQGIDTQAAPPVVVSLTLFDGTILAKLAALADNWDGEGAPPPAHAALVRADEVIRWALRSGLVVDVEPDVLGGVGVWLTARPNKPVRSAWVALMNNGSDTIVFTEEADVRAHAAWTDERRAQVVDFLRAANHAHADG